MIRLRLALAAALCLSAVAGPPARGQPAPGDTGAALSIAPAPGSPAADPAPEVSLSARGAFSEPAARVGDSLDYVITVEWEDGDVPVAVLAPDSVSFPGFAVTGQATRHRKTAGRNHTEFIYRLRAATPGSGRADPLKLRYVSGVSRGEEAVYVPAAVLDVQAARARLTDTIAFKIILWIFVLALPAGIGWLIFRLIRKGAPKEEAPAGRAGRPALAQDAAALKARLKSAAVGTATSKEVLLEMEALGIRHLRLAAGLPDAPSPADKFEPLLDAHLKRSDGSEPREDWEKLKDLFRHARFAGGHKEPHELQDAYRTLKKCLNLNGEDEHD